MNECKVFGTLYYNVYVITHHFLCHYISIYSDNIIFAVVLTQSNYKLYSHDDKVNVIINYVDVL